MHVTAAQTVHPPLSPWTGTRAGVLGLGRSGLGALRLLARHGAVVQAFEDRISETLIARVAELGIERLEPRPASDDCASAVRDLDVLVVSPGVRRDHPLVRAAETQGVPVLGELEVALRRTEAEVVAITGTNGKSTTVSLVHAMLRAAGRSSVLAGNIGVALSDEVESVPSDGVLVVEASSFQLERVELVHPRVAAVLNVAPDHLDRYEGIEDYARAKRNLLKNLTPDDLFVYPADDPRLSNWAAESAATPAAFGAEPGAASASWIDGENVLRRTDAGSQRLLGVGELALVGRHNLLNVTAAVACVEPFDLPAEAIAEALRSFRGLPHRAVHVPTVDGRIWIDDSKATNVHAAAATLSGLAGPVVLLAGGSGKGEDYTPLADFADRLRAVICFGDEAERIESALRSRVRCERERRMADALRRAAEIAQPGDTVLLSPACASFDEFTGFAQRGETFVAWIEKNVEGGS